MFKEKVITDAKYSVRSFDENGYLHVEMTPISKATVNPYKGSELQGLTDVKLEPNRIYYGYRDPKELEKGADTFNGLFLLDEHHEIDATSIPKEYIIGTVGTDAKFKDGYLYNSLVIADQEAINNVEDKTKWEISSAYKFVPVFKEGEVETDGGEKIHYDFVMTDIRGNHVALVPEGRAGHDVRVADSKGEIKKMEKKPICSADGLKLELCEMACIHKLSDIVDRVASLNLDIEIEDVLKNKADKIIAIIMKNDGHTFNVGYDDTGSIRVCELISDDDAVTVFNAYAKGLSEAQEQHMKECEIKHKAECIAQEKLAEQVAQAPSVVVVEQPSKAEEVIAAEISPKPITEELVSLIADTPAVVGDDGEVLAEVTELEHKEDEYDEQAFEDIKERFANARFNSFDDFVQEIGKFGVSVGKVTVVRSGLAYKADCIRGQKVFYVKFKQQDRCIEIYVVSDQKNEMVAKKAPDDKAKKVVGDKKVAKVKDELEQPEDLTNPKKDEDMAEDGGPGSGRKKGSKNGVHMTPPPEPKYPTKKKMDNKAIVKSISEKINMNFTPREKAAIKQKATAMREKLADEPVQRHKMSALGEKMDMKHRAKGTTHPEDRDRQRQMGKAWRNMTANLDSKKKVKGCVGDAELMQQGDFDSFVPDTEKGLVTDVFGLLMHVLGSDFITKSEE